MHLEVHAAGVVVGDDLWLCFFIEIVEELHHLLYGHFGTMVSLRRYDGEGDKHGGVNCA